MEELAQKAINLALSGNWEKALIVNLEILEKEPEDKDALNRTGRAYAELGKIKQAKQFARKVLKIDPHNKIATKSLEKWQNALPTTIGKVNRISPQFFLEEPGKTKIVNLINLGDSKIIFHLDSGDPVELVTRKKSICVLFEKKYIGRIPDDLSARLRELMKYGNQYQALIKTANKGEVKLFLREIKRTEKLKNIPSFSGEKVNYIAFTPPELVHKKEDISSTNTLEEYEDD